MGLDRFRSSWRTGDILWSNLIMSFKTALTHCCDMLKAAPICSWGQPVLKASNHSKVRLSIVITSQLLKMIQTLSKLWSRSSPGQLQKTQSQGLSQIWDCICIIRHFEISNFWGAQFHHKPSLYVQ